MTAFGRSSARTAGAGAAAGADAGTDGATAHDLRAVFRRWAAGVAVVTADGSGGPVGFTATSLASVSAQPPLVSFNVAVRSSSWPALETADVVGVSVLGEHQEGLATRFATPRTDRFAAPTAWARGPHGAPLLDGVAAWLVASVEQRVEAGDHVIVVARVLASGTGPDGVAPLVHHDGRFSRLADRTRLRLLRRPPS